MLSEACSFCSDGRKLDYQSELKQWKIKQQVYIENAKNHKEDIVWAEQWKLFRRTKPLPNSCTNPKHRLFFSCRMCKKKQESQGKSSCIGCAFETSSITCAVIVRPNTAPTWRTLIEVHRTKFEKKFKGLLRTVDSFTDLQQAPLPHQLAAVQQIMQLKDTKPNPFFILNHDLGTGRTSLISQLYSKLSVSPHLGGRLPQILLVVSTESLDKWYTTLLKWLDLQECQILKTNLSKDIRKSKVYNKRIILTTQRIIEKLYGRTFQQVDKHHLDENGKWVSLFDHKGGKQTEHGYIFDEDTKKAKIRFPFNRQWDMLIVDNAQQLLTTGNKTSKAYNAISKQCTQCILITAHNMTTQLSELASMCFIGDLPPKHNIDYSDVDNWMTNKINKTRFFKKHMLSVTVDELKKDSTLNLPVVNTKYVQFKVDFDAKRVSRYNCIISKLPTEGAENFTRSESNKVMYRLQRLDNFIVSPVLVKHGIDIRKLANEDDQVDMYIEKYDTASLRCLAEELIALQKDGNRRIVVSSVSKIHLQFAYRYLTKVEGLYVYQYESNMKISERKAMKTQFLLHKENSIMLIRATRRGVDIDLANKPLVSDELDLTYWASCQAMVFWGSLPLSQDVIRNCMSSINRIGQDAPKVLSVFLYPENSFGSHTVQQWNTFNTYSKKITTLQEVIDIKKHCLLTNTDNTKSPIIDDEDVETEDQEIPDDEDVEIEEQEIPDDEDVEIEEQEIPDDPDQQNSDEDDQSDDEDNMSEDSVDYAEDDESELDSAQDEDVGLNSHLDLVDLTGTRIAKQARRRMCDKIIMLVGLDKKSYLVQMDKFPLPSAIFRGLKSRPENWVANINISGCDPEGFDNMLQLEDQYHQMVETDLTQKSFYPRFMSWLDKVYTNIEPLSQEEEYTQEDYDYTIVTTDKNIYCVLLKIEQEPGAPTPITRYLVSLDKYPLSDDIMEGIQEHNFQGEYIIDVDAPNPFVQISSQSTQISEDMRTDFIEWLQVVTHSNAGLAVHSSTSPVYDFSILLPVATKQISSPVARKTEDNMLVSYGETTTSQQVSYTALNPDDLTELPTATTKTIQQVSYTVLNPDDLTALSMLVPRARSQTFQQVSYTVSNPDDFTGLSMLMPTAISQTFQQFSSTILNQDDLTELTTLVPRARSQTPQTTPMRMRSPSPVLNSIRNVRKRPDSDLPVRRSSRIRNKPSN